MTLTINGTPRSFDSAPADLSALLAALGLAGKPVVVELDRSPVLPADYGSTPLRDGAVLEIVTIAAGG